MILTVIAPVLLLAVAVLAFANPGRRPGAYPVLAESAGALALGLVALGSAQFVLTGASTFTVNGVAVLKGDVLSVIMTLLVSFVGWIVLRYARSYLDGEAREGAFHGLILAAIAAVLVLVQAANLVVVMLSFIAIGLVLRTLLLFYAERPEARRAAAKFIRVWSLGDIAILLAALLLFYRFGTLDIAGLRAAAQVDVLGLAGHVAVALLVLAALCKTASFPLHGWLTEVMEAPTPVSALLHAGVINSGGVLLIMLADLVQASPGSMAALVMVGGLTALFGAMVMLTQSAIKTALAWSTVSQMGFMMLQCGLGLWVLALLHIVAHSLYKAHAFLGSGSAVQAVLSVRRPGPVAAPGLAAVAKAFVLALVLYAVVAFGFSALLGAKSPQALALGVILIFGVAYLVAQGLADAAPEELTRRTAIASVLTAFGYFGFHVIADWIAGSALPSAPVPDALEWALIVLTLVSFGTVAVAQSLFPNWAHHPAAAGLRVHMANGLYLNATLDRLIGGFRTSKPL